MSRRFWRLLTIDWLQRSHSCVRCVCSISKGIPVERSSYYRTRSSNIEVLEPDREVREILSWAGIRLRQSRQIGMSDKLIVFATPRCIRRWLQLVSPHSYGLTCKSHIQQWVRQRERQTTMFTISSQGLESRVDQRVILSRIHSGHNRVLY
jgi:hypothetical protein